jgi:hypothetical protein
MVDVLDYTSDEACERERRSIEESDGESHSGRNPLGVPRSTLRRVRLERGDQAEHNRRGEHEDCAFLWEATVACSSSQQGVKGLLYPRLTKQPCKAEPNIGHWYGKRGAWDRISPVV